MPSHPTPEPPELTPARHATVQWRVRLLGGLQAQRGDVVLSNFGSRGVAALLAQFALYPQRSHGREALIELLWPGVGLDVGRNRLRQALFTLRQLLEPPGPVAAPVLLADRLILRVVPGALECDATLFERCVREGRHAQAVRLYTGELLPGFYDAWIDDERVRLAALFERASAAANIGAPVAAPSAAVAAPGSAPAVPEVGRSTLPVYLTRFFGREAEGARLRAEVLGHRLVTLLGPGGGGKTRLAVELAQSLREPGPHAVGGAHAGFDFIAFVPLAGCETHAQVLDKLLAGLHLRPQDGDPFEPLVAALAGRRSLLVLDNFEQLAGVAEDLVARLARRIPGLHLLVTSRRVLGLDGEREFAIQPLRLPAGGLALDEAAINPAVSLFVDRARAVRADFHIGPSNVAAIIELVHLLEGLPLAIELAAARTRSIAPGVMVELLREARRRPDGRTLELLARGAARSGSDRRHTSMLRLIEWSWRLLEPAQAELLAAVTVFHGGFDARAVHAVCGGTGADASVRLDELVAHSLLRVSETEAGTTRYAAFEPVREYAALQLDAEAARHLRERHRAWLAGWTASQPATPVLSDLRVEMPNLLAALASALADGVPDDAIRLLLPLRAALEDVELPPEGLSALARAVARCTDAALRSRGHTLLAPLLFLAGQSAAAMEHAELGLAGAAPGTPWRGRALHAAARVRWRATRRDDGVSERLDEAEVLARDAVDTDLLAGIHTVRAYILDEHGEHARSEALHAQALALWEQGGNRHAINSGLYRLACCAQIANRHEEALARLAVIEPRARALHDWRRVSQILNVRGNALSELRRWPAAVASFRDCAQLAWACLALHELAFVLWNLPRALAHVREPERAVALAGFAEAFWSSRFGRLNEADVFDMRRVRRLSALQIGSKRVTTLWARGAALTLADAVTLALGAAPPPT